MALEDKTLVCRDCGREFVFTTGEQEFYISRGLQNEPGRCPECRAVRRRERRGEFDRPRKMYTVICAQCGVETTVPFEPKEGRPVYCKDCYTKQKDNAEVQYLIADPNSDMNVGVCKITLRLPENLSLKGKRRVIRSIVSQVKNKYNVSIAEVADQDLWQSAVLGFSCVSNDKRFANEVLSKVVDFIVEGRYEVEVLDYEIEILPVL